MSFKQLVKPRPPRLDGAARFGRFTVHPDATGASCADAPVHHDASDADETTVRLSEEQLPVITSVRPAHRADLGTRVFNFLRWQGPMMLTGMVLGFSFFTIARVPLGASSAPLALAPRAVAAAPAAAPPAVAPPAAAPAVAAPLVAAATPPLAEALPARTTLLPRAPMAVEPTTPTETLTSAPRTAPHRRHTSKRATRAACDPPFRYDADGIKRIKLKCV